MYLIKFTKSTEEYLFTENYYYGYEYPGNMLLICNNIKNEHKKYYDLRFIKFLDSLFKLEIIKYETD